jgi:copper chaperone NosL
MTMRLRRAVGAALLAIPVLAAAGCSLEPQPLRVGLDECARCRMTLSEAQFAGQLLTRRGRVLTFDSVECLAGYVNEGTVPVDDLHSLWVMDFNDPEHWIPAERAVYLQGDGIRSPMGLGLTAHVDAAAAAALQRESGGEIVDWDGVRAFVERSWAEGGAPHVH